MIIVSSEIVEFLPISVKDALEKMSSLEQKKFEEELRPKLHKPNVGLCLALFLPGWSFVYRGLWGMAFLFWFTGGGFWIWWVMDIFTVKKAIRQSNQELAMRLMRDIKILTR